jgi:hypothetical protein
VVVSGTRARVASTSAGLIASLGMAAANWRMVNFDLIRVTGVRYVRDHVLWLRFSDGLSGEVDLADVLVGPVLGPLRDPEVFAQVRVIGETIAWPNGADWAPETLYERLLAGKGHGTKSAGDGAGGDAAQLGPMPEISRFFGIVIRMFFVDHARPHFHAMYGEHSLAMEIAGDGVTGSFPPHRLPLLYEWRDLHRDELIENWTRLRDGHAPRPIPPLE